VVPIYNVEDRELQLWISEGVVEILNMDKKPCSLDDLKQPKQQKVFVPEVKNTTKRPVLRKVKK
ncbi:hypothetical protein KA005_04975, partial [bacterium]|nr:hypothetical protein [bacterium]